MPVAIDRNGSPLPVAVNSQIKLAHTSDGPLPVGVTAIRRTAEWDGIDTNVPARPLNEAAR